MRPEAQRTVTYDPVTLESLLAHQGWALRMARRLVREEDEAEDLVQRTWIAALRRPPATERGARAWIRTVILNLARERYRRDQTRVRHERASLEAPDPAEDAAESASRAEICALLGEELLLLDEPYRAVLLLRFYEGLTSPQIGERLGIPAGTVRWRLKIGIDQLRTELDRRSQGDRTRWVTALLPLAAAGRAREPHFPALEPTGGAPAGSGVLVWTGLGALAVLGVFGTYLLAREPERVDRAGAPSVAAGFPTPVEHREERPPPTPSAPARVPTIEGVVSRSEPPEPLHVRVVDAQGEPMGDAVVQVGRAGDFEERARTDASGRAAFPIAPEDTGALGLPFSRERIALRALAPGRAASRVLHARLPTGDRELELVVGGPALVLRGVIVDPRGAPVPGARVAWFNPMADVTGTRESDFESPFHLSTTADQDGHFELAHAWPGGSLLAVAPGHPVTLQTEANLVRDETGSIRMALAEGASLSGHVRWASGRPAADVRVGIDPRLRATQWSHGLPGYDASYRGFVESTRTDADGAFHLQGVLPGTRTLWALDEAGGQSATLRTGLEAGGELRWEAVLAEGSPLAVHVVDSLGAPLAGWMLHARARLEDRDWWIRRVATDSRGQARLLDCPAAEVRLDVLPPEGVGSPFASLRLRPGGPEHEVVVDVRVSARVSGRLAPIRGADGAVPELGFHSLATGRSIRIEPGPDGAFELRLAPADYLLAVNLGQSRARLASFRLSQGQELALGLLSAPPLGSLRLEGSALDNGQTRRPSFSLFRQLAQRKRFVHVGSGRIDGELVIPVFSGHYRVLAFDAAGSAARALEIEVRPYEEAFLPLGP